jgi:hypothetical protein
MHDLQESAVNEKIYLFTIKLFVIPSAAFFGRYERLDESLKYIQDYVLFGIVRGSGFDFQVFFVRR